MGRGRSAAQGIADVTLGSLDRCPVCRAASAGSTGVCAACGAWLEAAARALPPPAGELCWVGPHAGPLLRCVAAFKHGGGKRLGEFLGQLVATRVERWGYELDVVTHVPASGERSAERGFDQAAVLAAVVSRAVRRPHLAALARSPVAASQKRLTRAGRAANAGGAFGATRGVSGRVLLVDDVLTTGATYRACVAALMAAGATEVRGAFVARTVRSAPGRA
ncbi:MAG TPA: hypothetical protein VF164_11165 [Trueperaceae bacterium]